MKLVLVRHVETYGNIEHRLNGHTESNYTSRGEAMKKLLVEELVTLDQKLAFDRIFSSPTSRAYCIAAAVGEATGKEILVDHRLREFNFGIFEGKTKDEWELWMNDYLDYVVPEGQSQREYHSLCREFLAELQPDETVLLVAHGGTVHGMLTNLLELPIESKWHFDIQLGSITVVNYNDGFGMLSYMTTPPYEQIELAQQTLGEANASIVQAAVTNH